MKHVVYGWTLLSGLCQQKRTLCKCDCVRQETIPTLISKDAEIIKHQSGEHPQTQSPVLGGKAGAASTLHMSPTLLHNFPKKKKKPSLFSQIL